MKIAREELYRRVWETPVRTLAKEFDISDVGLSKACRRADIPLPPVGYWTKVQHGQAPKRPPLPKSATAELVLDAARNRTPATQGKRSEVPKFIIDVPNKVATDALQPFTKATADRLGKVKATPHGFMSCAGPGVFECTFGEESFPTALTLLNAIESTLPRVGASLVKGKEAQKLAVEFEGQKVEFKLSEQTSRTEVVVKDKYYKGSIDRDYTYSFTGQFALTIDGYFEGRKRWADGKRETLKDKLGDFVLGLVEAAKALKRRAVEKEEQRLRWAEEARKREEVERHRRYMDSFRDSLITEATAAQESVLMKEYVHRLHESLERQSGELSEAAREWLARAEDVAAIRDPLERRVQRLLNSGAAESYYGYFGQQLVTK
jgi:hypothetical protein